jgi:hypothetical protein
MGANIVRQTHAGLAGTDKENFKINSWLRDSINKSRLK